MTEEVPVLMKLHGAALPAGASRLHHHLHLCFPGMVPGKGARLSQPQIPTPVHPAAMCFFCRVFCFYLCVLRERERERETEQGTGRGRGRSRHSPLSREPNAEIDPRTLRSPPSHPCTPLLQGIKRVHFMLEAGVSPPLRQSAGPSLFPNRAP